MLYLLFTLTLCIILNRARIIISIQGNSVLRSERLFENNAFFFKDFAIPINSLYKFDYHGFSS